MVEEIESEKLDAAPKPTLTADPTATPSLITEILSDQGLANLTGVQVDGALIRFAFVEEWDYTDKNKSIGPAVNHFHFRFGHIYVRDPIIPYADSSNYKWRQNTSTSESATRLHTHLRIKPTSLTGTTTFALRPQSRQT
tara:strand:+ start:76 stop:492 length:417 start_codon:yes stop_codon:yes gene_type:complete